MSSQHRERDDRIDLNLLRVLDAVLQCESVGRAATRLGVTQPAVSRQLARLRERLGDPLLVRTGSSMVATERALRLRDPVHEALARAEALFDPDTRFDPATLRRRFKVASTDYAVTLILPALLARLQRHAPEVDLDVVPLPSNAQLDFDSPEIDVFIVHPDWLPATAKRRILFDDRFSCLARTGHPLVGRAVSIEQFSQLRHILVMIDPLGHIGGPVDAVLAAQGLRRRVGVTVTGFMTAAHLVAQTDLVATLPRRSALQSARMLAVRTVELPVEIEGFSVVLGWHARHHDDPAHRWFRGQFATASKKLPA